jgi:hypothetical protein
VTYLTAEDLGCPEWSGPDEVDKVRVRKVGPMPYPPELAAARPPIEDARAWRVWAEACRRVWIASGVTEADALAAWGALITGRLAVLEMLPASNVNGYRADRRVRDALADVFRAKLDQARRDRLGYVRTVRVRLPA